MDVFYVERGGNVEREEGYCKGRLTYEGAQAYAQELTGTGSGKGFELMPG